MSSIKILVVEDFVGYRRFVCSLLQDAVECQISEVADGLAALEKAELERPDLVLMDVGLPGLNGIEAGRRIREVSPNSKILYISQESSVDVVQEALRLGALGYVFKADTADELLIAADAVLRGRQFVSRRFAAAEIGDAFRDRAEPFLPRRPLPVPQKQREVDRFHEVASYRDEASFVEDVGCFVETALRLGNPVILIASEAHQRGLLSELEGRGWDVAAAIREGRYIALDASETLATFMVNDWPDATRLAQMAGSVISRVSKTAKAKHSKIAVFGECAPTLLAEGKTEAAFEVEHLWDDLAKKLGLQILCGYLVRDFKIKGNTRIFERICAQHSAAYSI